MDHFLFPWTERLLRPDSFTTLSPSPNVLRNTELYNVEKLAEVIGQFEVSDSACR
jgi:hypothetical protein